jgi:hypothetical protein
MACALQAEVVQHATVPVLSSAKSNLIPLGLNFKRLELQVGDFISCSMLGKTAVQQSCSTTSSASWTPRISMLSNADGSSIIMV